MNIEEIVQKSYKELTDAERTFLTSLGCRWCRYEGCRECTGCCSHGVYQRQRNELGLDDFD